MATASTAVSTAVSTIAFIKGRDYSEIGPLSEMIAKYPPADPVPTEIAALPKSAKMALIYSRTNRRWNTHLYTPIAIDDRIMSCVGLVVVTAAQQTREAAILLAADGRES
jgi:hypothetical protein